MWKSGAFRGRRVYVELVDGDAAGAYAWLAAGRFSEQRLNPLPDSEHRHQAIELCRDLRLQELRPDLVALVSNTRVEGQLRTEAALAVAEMAGNSRLRALATIAEEQLPEQLREACLQAVAGGDADSADQLLREAAKLLTRPRQSRLAVSLASDRAGARQLLELLESGVVSRSLLADPALRETLRASAGAELETRLAALSTGLADETATDRVVHELVRRFLERPGDPQRGQVVFEKTCAACHQIAGRGRQVEPNLDGVATRGLERLVEDVLAPNRNVDPNFRATTVVTTAGKVHTGFVRDVEGAGIVIIDNQGRELPLTTDAIAERVPTRLSPMPAGLGEILTKTDMLNLLAYLLSNSVGNQISD